MPLPTSFTTSLKPPSPFVCALQLVRRLDANGRPEVVLADFGCCRSTQGPQPSNRPSAGTPLYRWGWGQWAGAMAGQQWRSPLPQPNVPCEHWHRHTQTHSCACLALSAARPSASWAWAAARQTCGARACCSTTSCRNASLSATPATTSARCGAGAGPGTAGQPALPGGVLHRTVQHQVLVLSSRAPLPASLPRVPSHTTTTACTAGRVLAACAGAAHPLCGPRLARRVARRPGAALVHAGSRLQQARRSALPSEVGHTRAVCAGSLAVLLVAAQALPRGLHANSCAPWLPHRRRITAAQALQDPWITEMTGSSTPHSSPAAPAAAAPAPAGRPTLGGNVVSSPWHHSASKPLQHA